MKIFCKNTLSGLIPLYPTDQDEKKKLRIGQDYECDIKNPRNYEYHKRFFALINLGHHNTRLELPFDVYRKIMTMRAGYFKAYDTDKGIHYEADSISFGSKTQDEFEEIYSRVLDEIIKDIGSTSEEIEKELINFM